MHSSCVCKYLMTTVHLNGWLSNHCRQCCSSCVMCKCTCVSVSAFMCTHIYAMFEVQESIPPNKTVINPVAWPRPPRVCVLCVRVCVCVWPADWLSVVYYLSTPVSSFMLLWQQFPMGDGGRSVWYHHGNVNMPQNWKLKNKFGKLAK